MESIGKECKELKKQYDDCFNAWFAERYLKGDHHSSHICDSLFITYQGCVREAIKQKKIDLWQIEQSDKHITDHQTHEQKKK
ncbi:TP53-regulated inhibitor of apoptosis 1 [Blomia tropicalis]|nr:TP53-regulated inhibitor of apoptosis 1 [Blomia tropicalis]